MLFSESFMEIVTATISELSAVLAIYERARRFMAEHGNPDQWGTSEPTEEQIRRDIDNRSLYLCRSGNEILGVFYYAEGEDEAYAEIDGKWLNDSPYSVVHRIASSGKVRGSAEFCLGWAFDRSQSLRIDTHEKNIPMQNLLAKLGFKRCGIITLRDGTKRIAYQKIK